MHHVAFTFAESRREANAQQILKGHDTGKERTVSRPDLSHCFPSAAVQQVDKPAAVEKGIKIHTLLNDIHNHDETHLKEWNVPVNQAASASVKAHGHSESPPDCLLFQRSPLQGVLALGCVGKSYWYQLRCEFKPI